MEFVDIIFALVRENRPFVIGGLILVVASAIANIVTINNINLIIESEGAYILNNPSIVIAVLACAFAFAVSSQMILTQMGYRVVYQLRGRLLQQVLNTDYEQLERIGKHKIYAAISKDLSLVQNGFSMMPFFVYAITLVFSGAGYLFYLNHWLACIVVFSLLLATVLVKYLVSIYQGKFFKDRDLEDELYASYEQLLDGHKELLLNERRGKSMHASIMSGAALQSMQLRTLGDRYMIVSIHFMSILILVLVVVVFWMIYQFDWGLSPQSAIAVATSFSLTLIYIRQPLNMAMNQIAGFILASVSLKKIRSLNLSEITRALPTVPALQWQTLELKNVTYKYPNDSSGFALGPINLTINKGQLIFLAGHNGAGKTTLIRIILGLIRPQTGSILVDKSELTNENIRAFRQGFSAVLADFHLFDNLDHIDSHQSELVEHWLRALDLHDKVKLEVDKFSSTDLSTGQRKRLAMVSAVAENRHTMILDEWAADQDPVFRKRFYFDLLPKLKAQGYTLIVVSHDDRYFSVADRIIYLNHGQIEEK